MTQKIDYKKLFSRLGVREGDMLYIASNILPLILNFKKNKINFDSDNLINNLKESVGKNGTLLFHTYNWDFCKKKHLIILKHQASVGR